VIKYKNFSNYKIVFRCDAADIPEVGSGHVYRSIIIAHYLKKKFNLKFKQISFLVKTKNKYSKSLKILNKHNFKILKIDSKIKDYSKKEAEYFKNFKANLLIIDRLGKVTKEFSEIIKDNYKKKIIIDDSSSYRKFFDLSLNPLIQNVPSFKGSKTGYQYLILDNFKKNNSKIKIQDNNIFIFFGGYDSKKLSIKTIKLLDKLNLKLSLILPLSYKDMCKRIRSKHKLVFFKSEKYLIELKKSNIVITAGGLGLFDAILNKKKIICIPQYKHQEINAKKIAKTNAINFIDSDKENFNKKLITLFVKIYKDKQYLRKINAIQNKIINIKKINNTLRLISNIYDKSNN